MAPRTNEDFKALENKINDLEKQLSDFPKVRKIALKLEEDNTGLKEENSQLKSDNKSLSKSGAVINSSNSTFDITTAMLENGCKKLFRTNHGPKDWDDHYRYNPKGPGEPVNYLIQYRDGKFKDSMIS